ncbi:MAG: hypothetical protein J0L61_05165, partial [Planctomycetes bacterium]|nr:hypothetical protein [Planctomycetota bacterium]
TVARANGNELDNITAQLGISPVDGSDVVYFHIAGNLETNANKLEIFFDVIPGVGQNTLVFDDPADGYTGNPDIDFFALNRMGGPFTPTTGPVQPGLTFDAGFTADYYVTLNAQNANAGGTDVELFANWARLKDVPTVGDPGAKRYLGKTSIAAGGFFDGGDLLTNELALLSINNSNTGGVAGGATAAVTPTSDPANVITGIELGLPLVDLAPWDGRTSTIKMMVFINGTGHDFVSNQVLGSYCGTDLGEPRNVNFASKPGNQFFELTYNSSTTRYTSSVAQTPACTVPCVGDLNNDGQVNTGDLTIFLGQFGSTGSNLSGDFNNDGQVNTADLTTFLGRFGQPC